MENFISRQSPISGSGLFSRRSIEQGGTIWSCWRSDVVKQVLDGEEALQAYIERPKKVEGAQNQLKSIIPGLAGKFYVLDPDCPLCWVNHSDEPNADNLTKLTYEWLDNSREDSMLRGVALRPITEGEEITIEYNKHFGYDYRDDKYMSFFLALCKKYGVAIKPSTFRQFAATEKVRRTNPKTDPVHRSSLFIVPRNCILKAAVEDENWKSVSALTRINALSACKGAEHGWIGASFSCIDILIAMHMRMAKYIDSVILAKGHAAAAQYAVLFNTGEFSSEMLRQYKNGANCPEAHADILCDTGSLGQCLSTVAGMASASPHKHFGVVLGDGELQEGQNYEALMTIRHHNISNITIVVDRNGFQSDNLTSEIMNIHNLERVLEGFGFSVLHVPNGHDINSLCDAIMLTIPSQSDNSNSDSKTHVVPDPKLYVIIADTKKASHPLTSHMQTAIHPETGLLYQPWHTKVPSWQSYTTIIEEQLDMADSIPALQSWEEHKLRMSLWETETLSGLSNSHRPSHSGQIGTGKAFGSELVRIVSTIEDRSLGIDVRVVSCDLATSCGINGLVGKRGKFYELGVAEQDAASFSAGLALESKGQIVPVFCTYSNFLKRCYEQIFINAVQGARMIYAGTYSGLCYHTDGKSHQSFDDIACMLAIPGMVVFDPISPEDACQCLLYALRALSQNPKQDGTSSFYFRLRRTPMPLVCSFLASIDKLSLQPGFTYHEFATPAKSTPSHLVHFVRFVCMGTVATHVALCCEESWKSGNTTTKRRKVNNYTTSSKVGASAAVSSSASASASPCFHVESILIANMLSNPAGTENCVPRQLYEVDQSKMTTIVVIEDDIGSLSTVIRAEHSKFREQNSASPNVKIQSLRMHRHGPSFRTLESCLQHHGFTVAGVEDLLSSL